MKSIHPSLLVATIVLNLAAVRLAAVILPEGFYFSFSAFLFDNSDLQKLPALVAKLAVPTLVSFLGMLALVRLRTLERDLRGDDNDGNITNIVQTQAALTFAYGAAFCALLMAWPYILLWDILIDPSLTHQRIIFLAAYFAYVIGYGYFALAGAETARLLMERAPSKEPFSLRTLSQSPFTKPIFDALSGSIATAFAALLVSQAG